MANQPVLNIQWVPIENLVPNPKNPNKHSDADVGAWVKILDYQGWRLPIVVNTDTNLMQSAHCRLMAAKKRGDKEVPVSYQYFKNTEQAYAFMVSDNAMAHRSALDFSEINLEVPNLGPDFDIDLLGIPDFEIEPADKRGQGGGGKSASACPKCGYKPNDSND